jgi:hypothetical protein
MDTTVSKERRAKALRRVTKVNLRHLDKQDYI